jgi:hypothetical protein
MAMRGINGGLKLVLSFGALTLLLLTTGCGSSGSDGPTSQTGVFLDSPVSGLGYYTATQQGMTGTGGAFQYQNGERVHFYLGNMEFCDVEAMPVVTPIDCVAGATDVTHPMVTNMLLLLQSIDYDNDPVNGIDITPVMHQEARNIQLNLDCDPNEFRENYDFNNYLQLLNMQNAFQDHEDRMPPYIEQARLHMQETIMENGLYGYRPEMQNRLTSISSSDSPGQ